MKSIPLLPLIFFSRRILRMIKNIFTIGIFIIITSCRDDFITLSPSPQSAFIPVEGIASFQIILSAGTTKNYLDQTDKALTQLLITNTSGQDLKDLYYAIRIFSKPEDDDKPLNQILSFEDIKSIPLTATTSDTITIAKGINFYLDEHLVEITILKLNGNSHFLSGQYKGEYLEIKNGKQNQSGLVSSTIDYKGRINIIFDEKRSNVQFRGNISSSGFITVANAASIGQADSVLFNSQTNTLHFPLRVVENNITDTLILSMTSL